MIKINCRRFFRPLINQRNDTIACTNSFWNQYFFVNQSDVRERKERIHKSAWGGDQCVFLKILPSQQNEVYLWKMATKVEMYSATRDSRKRYCGPWAEIGKYWPRKEPIRLQDSLPCPLKKKQLYLSLLGPVPIAGRIWRGF